MTTPFKTSTYHKAPYPSISPLRPELTQANRTVIITGGATGIGYAIARSFAQAKASTLILLGRRSPVVQDAVARLNADFPSTKAIGRICDVGDVESAEAFWAGLRDDEIVADVLVLSAGRAPTERGGILELGYQAVLGELRTNVGGHVVFSEMFYRQEGRDGDKRLYLLNVATNSIHDFVGSAPFPSYILTKNAGTLAIQMVAKDVKPKDMQVLSFHPGTVFTDIVKGLGIDGSGIDFDDPELPGNFAVWAASPEAEFLHGRFVWANWDVDELRSDVPKRIEEEANFLKVGVVGLT